MRANRSRFFLRLAILLTVSTVMLLPSRGSASEVALVGVTFENGERPDKPVPLLHVFSGRTMEANLQLEITGKPLPATLEARFFSVTNGVSAPLGPAVALGALKRDEQRFQSLPVAISIPTVVRRTEIDVQFQTSSATDTRPIGNVRLLVYPENLAASFSQWRTKLKKDGILLGIFGKSEALRSFFRENRVMFEDLGGEIPSPSVPTILIVGDATPVELENWQRRLSPDGEVRLVVFTHDPWRLPGVYSSTVRQRHITKVTSPILSQLASNPLYQASLLEILTNSTLLNQ